MSFHESEIFQFLAQYAYSPHIVYPLVIGMMILSGFGLPIPEEVTIISVGILAYMGANPEMFPPPAPDSSVVNGTEAAIITSLAVLMADMLVYSIGRFAGGKLQVSPRFGRFFNGKIMDKVHSFIKKYGNFAAFFFRFTPGIRFPGHLVLGMTKFSAWKFFFIDLFAVAISVPTQILLVAHFGEPILRTLHTFKKYILIAGAIFLVFYIVKKIKSRQQPASG